MGMLSRDHGVIRFGVFEVDLSAGELYRKGRKASLQEKPFQILALLLERPGEVVTREEVRQKLWAQDTFVDFDAGLNTAIRKLREALGDSADNPRFVQTLPRRGYRFIAPVDGVAQVAAVSVPHPRRVRLTVTVGIALVGLVSVVVIVGLNLRGRRESLPGTVESGQIRSLAVLPLENLTGDSGQEHFVDGMHDALITELAQIQSLRVISRTSVMRYKRTKESVTKVAEELNVDAVIEGAVMRSGQRLRITAQLVDARNDRHLWAKSYERDLSDVVALQGEVAREIAAAAKVELAPRERALLENRRHVNPEAYDAFLRGVSAAGSGSPEGFSEATVHFERATRKQPDFALAYSALALAYYRFSYGGRYAPGEFMPKAEFAARKALDLDETNADAHCVHGAILYRYHWNWQAAEREYHRVGELPGALDCPGYYQFLALAERPEEAVAKAQRERERDPLSPGAGVEAMGLALMYAGRYVEAVAEYKRAVEKRPDEPWIHYLLGRSYVLHGDLKQGIAELETAVERSRGDQRFVAYLGYAYAASGRTSEARKILRDLNTLSKQRYVSPYGVALIHVGLGEKEAALNWLGRAYEVHAFELAEMAADPRLVPLRCDPRYQDLAHRVVPPAAHVCLCSSSRVLRSRSSQGSRSSGLPSRPKLKSTNAEPADSYLTA